MSSSSESIRSFTETASSYTTYLVSYLSFPATSSKVILHSPEPVADAVLVSVLVDTSVTVVPSISLRVPVTTYFCPETNLSYFMVSFTVLIAFTLSVLIVKVFPAAAFFPFTLTIVFNSPVGFLYFVVLGIGSSKSLVRYIDPFINAFTVPLCSIITLISSGYFL